MQRIKICCIVMFSMIVMACTNPKDAVNALNEAGFTNVQVGGYDWFACSDYDLYSTNFNAIDPEGSPVSGTVCSGFLKGTAIKFDRKVN